MKKHQKLANAVLAVLITMIVLTGITAAGYHQGWFDAKDHTALVCETTGVSQLMRGQLSTPLKSDTALRKNDLLQTQKDARLTLQIDKSTLTANEETKLEIVNAQLDLFRLTVKRGEVFACSYENVPLILEVLDQKILLNQAVASVSVHGNAMNLYVYGGSVTAAGQTVAAGQTLLYTSGKASLAAFEADDIHPFCLSLAADAAQKTPLFLTAKDFEQVKSDREVKKQEELLERARLDMTDGTAAGACTVTIVCDSVLRHREQLDAGKEAYVPDDGVLLSALTVEFAKNETAFDVLKRVCEYADIPLEYSWTPAYDSYYIEGIGNLYEFDCGPQSGWMYKINEWFPNYGCSEYQLSDQDEMVWFYTCEGLGEDVK